jgi:hypothetical protein
MKRRYIFLATVFSLSLFGCLKDTPNNDFTKIGTVVEMPYSGKGFFSSDAITSLADTINMAFTVNIASPNVLSTPVKVTVAVDPALVDTYNASDTTVHYEVLPDSAFVFDATPITIPAGSRLDTLHVTFYRAKLDPSKSYMLPIVIKDASGHTISGNMGVHYYHFIGNPIAGSYTSEWIRYNNAAGTGTPTYDVIGVSIFSPISPTTISVPSGSPMHYLLSFTNTGGVLSNFTVAFAAGEDAAAGIKVTGGPTIILADPVAGKYEFNFTYDNLAGGLRNITDKYTK